MHFGGTKGKSSWNLDHNGQGAKSTSLFKYWGPPKL